MPAVHSPPLDGPSALPHELALAGWFLSAVERGNSPARLPAWRAGCSAMPVAHGRTHVPRLLESPEDAGAGDLVLFADRRSDQDELLTEDGPTVAQGLSEAPQRDALVKGPVWRSHLDRLLFFAEQNRNLSRGVDASGGEVLLVQQLGSQDPGGFGERNRT